MEELDKFCKELGLTDYKAAKVLGMSKQTISAYRQGKPIPKWIRYAMNDKLLLSKANQRRIKRERT